MWEKISQLIFSEKVYLNAKELYRTFLNEQERSGTALTVPER